MFFNTIKTVLLLSFLSALFLLIGNLFAGVAGIQFAFIMALIMNGVAYFFSEKIVLSMYHAKHLPKEQNEFIYQTIQELAHRMNIPMPKVWIIESSIANAFATGRNPSHASIAFTSGIMNLLEPYELRGVIAHELAHIKNRDILTSTIAATIAGAIGYLAHMAQRAALWGSFSESKKRDSNPLILLFVSILVPIAATLIQLAISRSREYGADETGALHSHEPLALASALKKLENNTKHAHFAKEDAFHASTASLFIVYPFIGKSWTNLFSTHPPMQSRIEKLEHLYKKMFS